MRCPQCDETLNVIEAADLELDQCPVCHGIWFDKDELKPFVDFVLENREDIPHDDYDPTQPRSIENANDEVGFNCPACGAETHKLNYGYDSNVILDRCRGCEGIWVESPEIIELAVYMKGHPDMGREIDVRSRMVDSQARLETTATLVKILARIFKSRSYFHYL